MVTLKAVYVPTNSFWLKFSNKVELLLSQAYSKPT